MKMHMLNFNDRNPNQTSRGGAGARLGSAWPLALWEMGTDGGKAEARRAGVSTAGPTRAKTQEEAPRQPGQQFAAREASGVPRVPPFTFCTLSGASQP